LLLVALATAKAVTVETKYGKVQGQSHLLHDGSEVNSFLAIPFAKPPVGELRFAVLSH
jgi:carboxylesterase type B